MATSENRQQAERPAWPEWVGLLLVLTVAAGLRLGWPGINSFGFDEARVSLLALQMARAGQIPSVGIPSSAGIPNPPLLIWLLSVPYAFSTDPLVATQFVAALNVASVLGIWSLARRLWGPWAAFSAGLLFASAPFGVLYSRSIWGQDLMVPLAVLWAWCALQAQEKHGPALAAQVALAAVAWQIHYSGAALIPVTLWLVLRQAFTSPRYGRRECCWVVLGASLAVAVASPFLVALLESGGMASLRAALARPASWHPEAWARWAEVSTGSNWVWLALGWGWHWPARLATAQSIARGLTALLEIAGGCGLLWSCVRPEGNGAACRPHLGGLLMAWAVVSPAIFLYSSTPVYHQYMLIALPALMLLAGRAAGVGERRWQGPLVAALALCVALAQGSAVAISIQENASTLHPGGLGTPLAYVRNMASQLRDGLTVYAHARSDAPEYDADAAALSVLFWDYPLRLVNGESALMLPPEGQPAHLLFMFPDSVALEVARETARIRSETAFPRRAGEPPYTALEVEGMRELPMVASPDQALENGLALVAWDAQRQGTAVQVLTAWQVTEDYVPGRYHQYNHLYAPGEETPLAVQDQPLSSAAWQVGDRVLTWATFEADAGTSLSVEVGMYTYPDLERVPVRGGGAPVRLPIEP